jgi:hypothetical protein
VVFSSTQLLFVTSASCQYSLWLAALTFEQSELLPGCPRKGTHSNFFLNPYYGFLEYWREGHDGKKKTGGRQATSSPLPLLLPRWAASERQDSLAKL